ncbi:MAG: alpha-ketoglutarate-dependent 2,4-dichlorophenoxyacetate dioxygenase [Gammaproteobacteria bacterium]|jgi:alpha-ketoglutarate-dependent 2,4-dichlorophenoxyacetate dioxygenase
MTNSPNTLTVRKLHPHLGAEIYGVDLAQSLSDEVFDLIVAAFNQYSVLVFRNQAINDDQQVAFSVRFHELETVSFSLAAKNHYVYELSNVDEHGQILKSDAKKRNFLNVNARWHTDSSFKPIPAMASILSGREIPMHERADTDFASMRVGYDELALERREALRGLMAVHHYAYSLQQTGDGNVPQAELDALPPSTHPILRVHPGSGEPSLFVSGHIESINGMPVEAGRQLAQELVHWCTRPEFVYSHEWTSNDLVMWDNRCTLHRATVVPEREIRRAHRTTVMGEGPVEALL